MERASIGVRIRLLLDEDVQLRLATALRAKGIDAISVQELGKRGLSDKQQLEFASAEGRALFTYNVGDFIKLHKQFIEQGKEHKGIIVSKQLPIGEALKRLCNLADGLKAEEMTNRLEFLSDWK